MEVRRLGKGMKRRRAGRGAPSVSSWLILLAALSGHGRVIRAAPCGEPPEDPIIVQDLESVSELSDAVNCTEGGQVQAVWTGSVALNATVVIGAGTFLTVTGEDGAQAVGAEDIRMFNVLAQGGLSISNVVLLGGSTNQGGAIFSNSATVTLEGCLVLNNSATDCGGAIWASGGELTIVGGKFYNNVARNEGGAVYAIDAKLTIEEDAHFDYNRAMKGGAIHCEGSDLSTSATTCNFDNATFVQNNASSTTTLDYDSFGWEPPWYNLSGGGAISLLNAESYLTSCSFEANYAQLSGGAIFGGNHSEITIERCTFQNNTSLGWGGAISGAAMLVRSTLLEANTVGQDGAAVSVSGVFILTAHLKRFSCKSVCLLKWMNRSTARGAGALSVCC